MFYSSDDTDDQPESGGKENLDLSIIDLTEENNLDELEWIDRQMQLEEQMYNLQSHLIMCTARAEKVITKGIILSKL